MDFSSHDGAQHREQRLRKALQIASEIAGISPTQAPLLIAGMRDERGTLQIRWHAMPSDRQRDAFATAWRLVGENAASVVHHPATWGADAVR